MDKAQPSHHQDGSHQLLGLLRQRLFLKAKQEDETKITAKKVTSETKKKAAAKKDEKKEVSDSKKMKKTPEEQSKGKKQEKKEKPIEPAKSPKMEPPAPSEKPGKAKAERSKEEIAASSTKKAMQGKKEEKAKTVEQEMNKEKSGPSSSVLKDKVSETKKSEKISKAGKDVKPIVQQPQVKKEEKSEPQIKKEVKPAPPEKAQTHKQGDSKPDQVVPRGKPEQKVLKQVKAITAEKTEKAEPQEKDRQMTAGSKTIYILFSEEKPAKITKVTDDVSSQKKQKNPISFFQCVYLDGYNGYGFQFPVTPAQRPGENSGKPNSPGQKQQGQ
ncbi:TRDN [Lemmus lemmus]